MSTADSAGTFAGWLRQQPDSVLTRMLTTRPDLLRPVPPDIAVLASRAAGRVSVELALDRLDRGSLQVVEALALLPDPSTPAQAARLLGVAEERLGAAFAELREAVVVWDDDTRLLPVVRELLPFPAGLGPPARQALAELPPTRLPGLLTDLRALLGAPSPAGPAETPGAPETTTAPETLDAVARLFEDDETLSRLLDAVPPKPREVVDLLAAGPPIGRMAGARRPVEAATADTPLRWLLAHGLLVAVDDYSVALPREVGLLVRGGRPFREPALERPPLDISAHQPSDVDATAAGQAFATVRLVESLLERWGVDPPGVLRSGGLGVRDLRRAARELDVDERLAALLIEIAHAAALLAPDGESGESWLPTLGTSGYDAWLLKPVADRWCALASAWLATTRVPALVGRREQPDPATAGATGATGATGPAGRAGSAPNTLGPDVDRGLAPVVRRDVLRLLAGLEPGSAPDGAALVDVVRWSSPRRGGQLRDDLTAWTREEAEWLGFTGRGALSSFGRLIATSVLTDPDDDGDGDAPHTLAGRAADALEPLLPQPLDHVLLQADLTAVAPGPLESELNRELSLVADVESTGGATVFRFSANSIRRALDAGRAAADIHALLAAKSRTPVPQPLTYLIDDVARRHGRIRVGSAGAYVRCDDPAVLSELAADRRVDSLRLHRLAPTVMVSPLAADRVAERLRELGFAPAAENPDGGLVLRRPDARRAPSRPRPLRRVDLSTPSPAMVAVAVRALRSGDRAATAARRHISDGSAIAGGVLPRSAASDTLSALRDAAATGRPLWIGYLNAQGQASSRIVEPQRLAGGYLTAYDHRRAELRTFAVHRITGVALLDADSADPDGPGGPDADSTDYPDDDAI